MEHRVDEKKFKKENRPATCTIQPWRAVIPANIRDQELRKIKQETIEAYGFSMDECNKRKVCIGKSCLGRPLPFDSPTARPYLDKLAENQEIKDGNLYIRNCNECLISGICTSPCAQVNDYMQRDKSKQPELVYKKNTDNFDFVEIDNYREGFNKDLEIPWGAVSEVRRDTIWKYLYEQKDFLTIANELGFHDQSRAKYEFYAGLTKMSEYASMQTFWNKYRDKLTEKQQRFIRDVYFGDMSLTEVAKHQGISKSAVSQVINGVINKHNIKWHVYVKKEKGKTIYNIPELMK